MYQTSSGTGDWRTVTGSNCGSNAKLLETANDSGPRQSARLARREPDSRDCMGRGVAVSLNVRAFPACAVSRNELAEDLADPAADSANDLMFTDRANAHLVDFARPAKGRPQGGVGLPTVCQAAHGASGVGAGCGDRRGWVESKRLSLLSMAIRMRRS